MPPLTELQLDHVVGDGGEPSFGNLLTVAHAVADVGAPADKAAVLLEIAQRTLGARRGDLELISCGKWIGLVEQGAHRLADALAVIERHTLRPIDSDAQRRRGTAAGECQVIQLVTKEAEGGQDQLPDPIELVRGRSEEHTSELQSP